MSFSTVIQEFGDLIGLTDLGREVSGVCSLMIDERWPVSVETQADHRVTISLAVGPLPLEERERVAVELLEANRRLAEVGAAFALNAVSDEIVLQTSLTLSGLTGTDVSAAVTRLINLAEQWTAANPSLVNTEST